MTRTQRERILTGITIISLFIGSLGFFVAFFAVGEESETIAECTAHYLEEFDRVCKPFEITVPIREQVHNFTWNVTFTNTEVPE